MEYLKMIISLVLRYTFQLFIDIGSLLIVSPNHPSFFILSHCHNLQIHKLLKLQKKKMNSKQVSVKIVVVVNTFSMMEGWKSAA